jgi:hypothetical protein
VLLQPATTPPLLSERPHENPILTILSLGINNGISGTRHQMQIEGNDADNTLMMDQGHPLCLDILDTILYIHPAAKGEVWPHPAHLSD